MSYSFDASKNPEYTLNRDVDSEIIGRRDQFEMRYQGREYIIFANSIDSARFEAEEIYKKVRIRNSK